MRIQSKGTKVRNSDIKYLNSARAFLNEKGLVSKPLREKEVPKFLVELNAKYSRCYSDQINIHKENGKITQI